MKQRVFKQGTNTIILVSKYMVKKYGQQIACEKTVAKIIKQNKK